MSPNPKNTKNTDSEPRVLCKTRNICIELCILYYVLLIPEYTVVYRRPQSHTALYYNAVTVLRVLVADSYIRYV
jgi:hypothetical protein